MIILHNEEAAVITQIEGSGQERKYHIRQVDGLEQELSHEQLSGCIWVTAGLSNPKMATDMRSELPEYHLPKAWFWKVIWRFRSYYYQSHLGHHYHQLPCARQLPVCDERVRPRDSPTKPMKPCGVLSIGVVLAIFV